MFSKIPTPFLSYKNATTIVLNVSMISIILQGTFFTMTDNNNNYNNNKKVTALPQSLNSYETNQIIKLAKPGSSLSPGKIHSFPSAPSFNKV